MTELHIDSKSHKFDRRNILKGAVALPAIAVPFIPTASAAEESPVFAEKQAWIAADTNNEMLNLMLEAAICSEISMDLIYNIISPMRRDIAVHVCQTIIEFEKARSVDWYVYRPTDEHLIAMEQGGNKGDVFVKKPARIIGHRECGYYTKVDSVVRRV